MAAELALLFVPCRWKLAFTMSVRLQGYIPLDAAYIVSVTKLRGLICTPFWFDGVSKLLCCDNVGTVAVASHGGIYGRLWLISRATIKAAAIFHTEVVDCPLNF